MLALDLYITRNPAQPLHGTPLALGAIMWLAQQTRSAVVDLADVPYIHPRNVFNPGMYYAPPPLRALREKAASSQEELASSLGELASSVFDSRRACFSFLPVSTKSRTTINLHRLNCADRMVPKRRTNSPCGPEGRSSASRFAMALS